MGIRFFSKKKQPDNPEIPPDRRKKLTAFIKSRKVPISEPALLHLALIHSSYAHEVGSSDNQRLEYLGDSVLALIINDYLFETHPDLPEGRMARVKAHAASEKILAEAATRLDLGSLILLGRGERQTGGNGRISILADALEAVIGAIYVHSGFAASRQFTLGLLKPMMQKMIDAGDETDPKTALQEFAQKTGTHLPVYESKGAQGPEHSRIFEISVSLDGELLATGKGSSRKKAEQAAARKALESLAGRSSRAQDKKASARKGSK